MKLEFKRGPEGSLVGPHGLVIKKGPTRSGLFDLMLEERSLFCGRQRDCRSVAERLCDPAVVLSVLNTADQYARYHEGVGQRIINRWPGFRDLACQETGQLMRDRALGVGYVVKALLAAVWESRLAEATESLKAQVKRVTEKGAQSAQ